MTHPLNTDGANHRRLVTQKYEAVRNGLVKSRLYEEAEVLERLQTPETKGNDEKSKSTGVMITISAHGL